MRTHGRRTSYQLEHERSVARKAAPPRDLVAWLVREYREEMPEALHSGGVWRDRINVGEADHGIHAVGGSLLGTPRTAEGFRRLTEESPDAATVCGLAIPFGASWTRDVPDEVHCGANATKEAPKPELVDEPAEKPAAKPKKK